MNIVTRLFTPFLVLLGGVFQVGHAQAIFSRFDFNALPLTQATVGPHATSTDPDGTTDGTAAYMVLNCQSLKGFDLTIPNTGNVFDIGSLGMTFRFRKTESRSDFFVRGGTTFHQTGGVLQVSYRTTDGASGYIDYGPFNTGYSLPMDGAYHVYSFVYEQGLGMATVTVDAITVWSNDGPNNRPLYWTGAPSSVLVGTVMDGNCPGTGTLDYAYFFDPDVPLGIEFLSFHVQEVEGNARLNWEAAPDMTMHTFQVERSSDGVDYLTIGELDATPSNVYAYVDVQPGVGEWFYRIKHVDASGTAFHSQIMKVMIGGKSYSEVKVWPNPCTGLVHVRLPSDVSQADVLLVDMQGKVALHQQLDDRVKALDLSNLPRGVYDLHCLMGSERQTRKLLLQ